MSSLLTTTAVTAAEVKGLVQTIDSRFRAFDKGQDLILERQKTANQEAKNAAERLDTRIEAIEDIKAKAAGALLFAQMLGITGVIGGVIAIIRMIRG